MAPYPRVSVVKNQSIAGPGIQASFTLIRTVHDELWLVDQQRYIKSSMPFMGVRVPVMWSVIRRGNLTPQHHGISTG